MKRIVFLIFITLAASTETYSQVVSISSMFKLLKYTNTQISDFLISKNFSYTGKEEKSASGIVADQYVWGLNYKQAVGTADAWLTKSITYENDGSNGKGPFLYNKIIFQTFSSKDYLAIKKELSSLGFKLTKEDDFEGTLVSIYENASYKINIFTSSSDHSWEISVKAK